MERLQERSGLHLSPDTWCPAAVLRVDLATINYSRSSVAVFAS